MNSSRLSLSQRDSSYVEKQLGGSACAEPIKKKQKNIREIYLQAVHHNKGFKRINKKQGITNLTNDELKNASFNGSSFLEKEYSLVQRIINDTKELKNIAKIKNDSKSDLSQSSRQIAPKYKTQEEYYEEVLQLKKILKHLQSNETVNKTKMEYYENELAKKEQEIIDLLDVKKVMNTFSFI
jgi:hypothetical protein